MRTAKFKMRVLACSLALACLVSCSSEQHRGDQRGSGSQLSAPGIVDSNQEGFAEEEEFVELRQMMVDSQLARRDITDPRVLEVMREVPRHHFVPQTLWEVSYADSPLPIGHGQTISQPYIVGLMTQLAEPQAKDVALDVGTGSGYQAAVLSRLVDKVYSIEIIPELADEAKRRLDELDYGNIEVRSGDGYRGWPESAPFDVIIVAAAPDKIPQPLIDQLAIGGRLVIPIGDSYQMLTLIEKQQDGSTRTSEITPVRFVPMTGEVEKSKSDR
jgi:protein-L-isoaspartate(D-aspartate) O-methyltransferase